VAADASRLNSGGVEHGDGIGDELPFPRPSNTITLKRRARYATWAFQARACATDHVGISSTGGP
jgi:hypothetical protein